MKPYMLVKMMLMAAVLLLLGLAVLRPANGPLHLRVLAQYGGPTDPVAPPPPSVGNQPTHQKGGLRYFILPHRVEVFNCVNDVCEVVGLCDFSDFNVTAAAIEAGGIRFNAPNGWFMVIIYLGKQAGNPAIDAYQLNIYNAQGVLVDDSVEVFLQGNTLISSTLRP